MPRTPGENYGERPRFDTPFRYPGVFDVLGGRDGCGLALGQDHAPAVAAALPHGGVDHDRARSKTPERFPGHGVLGEGRLAGLRTKSVGGGGASGEEDGAEDHEEGGGRLGDGLGG